MDSDKKIDIILLDDAFQHRYVKPGINILLVDYHRLIIYDKLLPAGRLREPLNGKNRADVVIVTKCPKELKPMGFRVITKAMDLFPYQHLYFTTLSYDPLKPVFRNEAVIQDSLPLEQLSDYHVLLVAGIASPRQMMEDLSPYTSHLSLLTFPDHHNFRPKDIDRINAAFAALPRPAVVVTTEKDAVRLSETSGLSDEVRRNLCSLPVKIEFMLDQEESFNQNIIGYVQKNSRNSILAKGKDDNKPNNGYSTGDGSRTISFRNN
jgi:tetraacyldisaccharide 4'-kinase